MNMPGFNADASLYKKIGSYPARRPGASLSFRQEGVVPAQVWQRTGGVLLGKGPVLNPEVMRMLVCHVNARSSQCYSNCIKKYGDFFSSEFFPPGYADTYCRDYAVACCINPNGPYCDEVCASS